MVVELRSLKWTIFGVDGGFTISLNLTHDETGGVMNRAVRHQPSLVVGRWRLYVYRYSSTYDTVPYVVQHLP